MYFKALALCALVAFANAAPTGCSGFGQFVNTISSKMCSLNADCTEGSCAATIIADHLEMSAGYELDLCNSAGATLSITFTMPSSFWTVSSCEGTTSATGWKKTGNDCKYTKTFTAGSKDEYFPIPELYAGDPTGWTVKVGIYARIQGFAVNAKKVTLGELGITAGATIADQLYYGETMCTEYNKKQTNPEWQIKNCPVPIPIMQDMTFELSGVPGSSDCQVTSLTSSNKDFPAPTPSGSTTPASSPSSSSSSDSGSKGGLGSGGIAGVTIACIAAVGAVAGFAAYRRMNGAKGAAGKQAKDTEMGEVKNPASENGL